MRPRMLRRASSMSPREVSEKKGKESKAAENFTLQKRRISGMSSD